MYDYNPTNYVLTELVRQVVIAQWFLIRKRGRYMRQAERQFTNATRSQTLFQGQNNPKKKRKIQILEQWGEVTIDRKSVAAAIVRSAHTIKKLWIGKQPRSSISSIDSLHFGSARNFMPHTHHTERHFTSGALVRDIVIGMSDGLTVPFALAAGLSGAVGSSRVVITAGLAEIAAGSIAMGLGGYLAARGDADHYAVERHREETEIVEMPQEEKREVKKIFSGYGLTESEAAALTDALSARPKAWVDFMMRFELGLEEPESGRALRSAMTIAVSYIVGGLIPLSPYMLANHPQQALHLSVGLTLLALAIFGYLKGRASGTSPFRSALQTTLIGGLAAAAAFALAKAIS